MCYPKPGPRCSPHAKAELNRLISTIAHLEDTSTPIALKLKRKAAHAHASWEATPAGMQELSARIVKSTSTDEKRFLTNRLTQAKHRREQQMEALKTHERRKQEIAQSKLTKPQKKKKIYRIGSLQPKIYEGEILEYAEKADAVRPPGHLPRHGSLYASPSLDGVGRWVEGTIAANFRNQSKDIHEINVDTDDLYEIYVRGLHP